MVRLAGFVAVLAEARRRPDVVLGMYVTNRRRLELQNMLGFFVNLATLRLRCDLMCTFREWLTMVRDSVADTQAHSEIPYEDLCRRLHAEYCLPPEIRLIFSVSEHTAPVRFGGLELTWIDRRMENMPWGFTLGFTQHQETNRCRLAFDACLYDPASVRAFLERYLRFLDRAGREPDRPLADLVRA
jgi:non-ribosomal peptide synthetase component F